MKDCKLKLSESLPYSIGGGMGSNLAWNVISVYFMFFATDVYGIDASTVGLMMLIARLVDTVTDPLMGLIGDATRTFLGKYRFWLIFGSPALGVIVYALFCSPDVSAEARTLYLGGMYILYSIVSTATNIPYHSLTTYMSNNVNERSNLVLIKQFMGIIALYAVQVTGVKIIDSFADPVEGYRYLGMFFGMFITLSFMLCAFGARTRDNKDTLPQLSKTDKNGLDLSLLATAFRTKSLLALIVASSTNTIANSIYYGFGLYFFTYVFNDSSLMAELGTATLILSIAVYIFLKPIHARLGTKMTFTYSTILAIIPSSVLFFIPEPSSTVAIYLLALSTAFGTAAGLMTWIMVTECADIIKEDSGKNASGISASSLTFSNKLGGAVGGWLSGMVLVTIGYVANAADAIT